MTHRLGPLRYQGRVVFESLEEQQSFFEAVGYTEVPAPGLILRMMARGTDDDGSALIMFMDRVRGTEGLGWNFTDYEVAAKEAP